jgi:hypothetical protein
MPIVRIIFTGKASVPDILVPLHSGLREIVASALSTAKVQLERDSVELVFEKGHTLNRGKDLKILIDANDFPERTENLQERAEEIAEKVNTMIYPVFGEADPGFVYITLSAGGLGKFSF